MREIIYQSEHDMIIYSNKEVIVVKDDKVRYLKSNRLLDLICLHWYMEEMNLSEDSRNCIVQYILDLYDEERGQTKNEIVLTKEQIEKINVNHLDDLSYKLKK